MKVVDEDWERALAIAPHPDDLEYDGVGAALARWTGQGKQITELMVTRGEAGIDSMEPDRARKVRTGEQRAAAEAVGARAVDFLDHPDGELAYGSALRRDLARAIRRHRPEVLISINFRDEWPRGTGFNHPDHRVAGPAIDAARDAANRWVFPELAADGLGPWQGLRFMLFGNSPRAAHFVDVGEHLGAGAAALAAHGEYLAGLGGLDADAHLNYEAGIAGEQAGVARAVLFELITL